jgi:hypothetical protein
MGLTSLATTFRRKDSRLPTVTAEVSDSHNRNILSTDARLAFRTGGVSGTAGYRSTGQYREKCCRAPRSRMVGINIQASAGPSARLRYLGRL